VGARGREKAGFGCAFDGVDLISLNWVYERREKLVKMPLDFTN
jgi:hypothetical protein